MQLMEMGIDVLCEKPLAITVADGTRMAETAQRTGRLLAVALMMRFFPHNRWLADLVEDGEIGEVREVIVEEGAPLNWPMASNSYFDRNATGGGVLFDSGVHFLRFRFDTGHRERLQRDGEAVLGCTHHRYHWRRIIPRATLANLLRDLVRPRLTAPAPATAPPPAGPARATGH